MAQLKTRLATQSALTVGRVRLSSAGEFFIESETEIFQAKRAASCLMDVAPGDLALAVASGSQAWVIEVLERGGQGRPVLRCEEGLELATGAQGLLVSGQRLDFVATEEIRTACPSWSLSTEAAQVRATRLNVVSRAMSGALGRLRMAAAVVESAVGRLTQRAKTAFRSVEGLDRSRAGKMRVEVEEDWTLRATDMQVKAEKKVRLDGEKIDLG
jgi:hypothetical protein